MDILLENEVLENDSDILHNSSDIDLGFSSDTLDLLHESIDNLNSTFSSLDFTVFSLPENNEYPATAPYSGGLYIECNTSQLGRVIIYIPTDYQFKSFAYGSGNNLINVRNTTIQGYMYRGGTLYNIYWSILGTAQYRLYNSGTYSPLTISTIYNTNLVVMDSVADLPVVPNPELYNLIIIFMLGVILVCLFMKKF